MDIHSGHGKGGQLLPGTSKYGYDQRPANPQAGMEPGKHTSAAIHE